MRHRRLVHSLIGIVLFAGSAALAAPVFQPGFHQALRASVSTSTRTTYRLKLPIGRAGSRLRISFKAGDGSLALHAAAVARAGTQGALSSTPVPITFGGAPGISATARQRVTSDPIALAVSFGEELYVSFDVDGSLAASNINAFPDSYSWSGSYAGAQAPPPGVPSMRAIGLDTIDVEADRTPAFVVLGDSISEGYVSGNVGDYVSRNDDYRNAWSTIAQNILKLPVANAAVSGQGLVDAAAALDSEVLTLQGITDCLVLIGTNDLWDLTADQIDSRLSALFDRLRPFCRVWSGTLLPKELTTDGSYPSVVARRLGVNDWIRHTARVEGIIDFEAALKAPGDVNHFAPGLGEDGIHPSIAGQRAMGKEAARVLSRPKLTGVSPSTGPASGGTLIALSGSNCLPGATVTMGGVPATRVSVSATGGVVAAAPAHDPGPVDIVLTNPGGQSSTLAASFTYQPAVAAIKLTIEAIAPTSGSESGGTAVQVVGSGFVQGMSVRFGSVPAQITSLDANSIQVIAPAHEAGPAEVTVTSPDGQSTVARTAFSFVAQGKADPNVGAAGAGLSPAPPPSGGCNGTTAPPSLALLIPALLFLGWRRRATGACDRVARKK